MNQMMLVNGKIKVGKFSPKLLSFSVPHFSGFFGGFITSKIVVFLSTLKIYSGFVRLRLHMFVFFNAPITASIALPIVSGILSTVTKTKIVSLIIKPIAVNMVSSFAFWRSTNNFMVHKYCFTPFAAGSYLLLPSCINCSLRSLERLPPKLTEILEIFIVNKSKLACANSNFLHQLHYTRTGWDYTPPENAA